MRTVCIYEPDMKNLSVKKSEIYRYLGYTQNVTNIENVEKPVEEILTNILTYSTPKVCYNLFPISFDDGIDFGFMNIKSRDLAVNLEGCKEAYIFAATIGVYTDRQIQKEMLLSPARACIYQAVGAAVIEAVCDDFNEYIKEEEKKQGSTTKPRYSPGYGDVSLEVQKDIFRELNCPKMAGITLSDSLHMIPEKSVTAFIGVMKKQGC